MTEPSDPTDTVADATEISGMPEISRMSYEQARDALVETVARLESGRTDLETSVALWERGEALAAHCTAALDRAEARLRRPGAGSSQDETETETD
ncbi:exodeoxyribonuclease 7 small subunit [Mobilicoccus caccae]|uniref:Exodeoxyribonuclease 7 small subunit n=2 Tax=Mobilicoccus caccae TaxID=1859295 RepID=A0ABQ6IUZ1_9MICO|nr:exodeoxyribonuclease VII small subunit [Mobilicoccus caccae]GMA40514.1 exodeoxyribonuclease 7 small subunit [Mobilicoccus caccae]